MAEDDEQGREAPPERTREIIRKALEGGAFKGSEGTEVKVRGRTVAVGRRGGRSTQVPEGETPATRGGEPIVIDEQVVTQEQIQREKEAQRLANLKRELERQQIANIQRDLQRTGTRASVRRGKRGEIILTEEEEQKVFAPGRFARTPKTAKVDPSLIKSQAVALSDVPEEPKEEPVISPKRFGSGTIEEAPPPKTFLEVGRKKRDVLIAKRVRGEPISLLEEATAVGQGIGASVLTTAEFFKVAGKGLIEAKRESPDPVTFATKVGQKSAPFIAEGVKQLPAVGQGIKRSIREEPSFSAGFVIGEVGQAIIGGKILKAGAKETVKVATRIDPKFRKVTTDVLGRETIKGVKGTKGKVDIDIVQPKKPKLVADLDKLPEPALKKKPRLPKTTPTQKRVLQAVKESPPGTAVSGSFAQETLAKKGRGFADIDIVTPDIETTAKLVKTKAGPKFKIVTQEITDSPLGKFNIKRVVEKRTGKVVADIDPLGFAEEGLIVGERVTTVQGVPFIDLKARFGAKVTQFARGKRTQKVIQDIELLSGGEVRGLKGQSVRGGFGFTFEEQAQVVGKTGDIITGQRDLFGLIRRREVPLERPLFASPFDVETGKPQLRKTRLGLAGPEKEATLLDIISGDFTLTGQKPQAVLFQQAKVSDVPRRLQPLFKKAKAGDVGAQAEFIKRFQEVKTKPGEFKAFGLASSEAEVIAQPGVVVKRGKTVGVTLIEGRRVPIIAGEIKGASKRTAQLQAKAQKGTITPAETSELTKRLAKETGFDVTSALDTRPVLSPTRPITSGALRTKEVTRKPEPLVTSQIQQRRVTGVISPTPTTRPVLSPVVSTLPSPPPSISPGITTPISPPSRSPPVTGRPSVPPVSPPVSSPPSVPPISPPPVTPPSPPPFTPPVLTPPTPPPVSPPVRPSPPRREDDEGGFLVEIRRRGIFQQVGIEPTPERAFSRASALVGGTASASLRVTPIGTDTDTVAFGKRFLSPRQFRQSKIDPDVFVERREKRIKSPGELAEITFKGIATQRQRRAKGFNIFGG